MRQRQRKHLRRNEGLQIPPAIMRLWDGTQQWRQRRAQTCWVSSRAESLTSTGTRLCCQPSTGVLRSASRPPHTYMSPRNWSPDSDWDGSSVASSPSSRSAAFAWKEPPRNLDTDFCRRKRGGDSGESKHRLDGGSFIILFRLCVCIGGSHSIALLGFVASFELLPFLLEPHKGLEAVQPQFVLLLRLTDEIERPFFPPEIAQRVGDSREAVRGGFKGRRLRNQGIGVWTEAGAESEKATGCSCLIIPMVKRHTCGKRAVFLRGGHLTAYRR